MGLALFAFALTFVSFQSHNAQAKTIKIFPTPILQIDAHPEELPNALRVLKTSFLLKQLVGSFRPGRRLERNGLFDARCSLHFKAMANPGATNYYLNVLQYNKQLEALYQKIKTTQKMKSSEKRIAAQADLVKKASWLKSLSPRGNLFSLYLSLCPQPGLLKFMQKDHRLLAGFIPSMFSTFRSTIRRGNGRKITTKQGFLWHIEDKDTQVIVHVAPVSAKTKKGPQRWSVGMHIHRTRNEFALDEKSVAANFPHKAPKMSKALYKRKPLLGATFHPIGSLLLSIVNGALQGESAIRYASKSNKPQLKVTFLNIVSNAAKLLPPGTTRAFKRSLWLGVLKNRLRFQIIDKDRNKAVSQQRAQTLARQYAIAKGNKGCLISFAFGIPESYIRMTPIEKRLFGKANSKALNKALREAGTTFSFAAFAGNELSAIGSALQSRKIQAGINKNIRKDLRLPPGSHLHTFGFCLKAQSLDVTVSLPNIQRYKKWVEGIKGKILEQNQGKSSSPKNLKALLSRVNLHALPKVPKTLPKQPITLLHLDIPRISALITNPKNRSSWYFLQKVFRKLFGRAGWLMRLPLVLQALSFEITAKAQQTNGTTTYMVDFTSPQRATSKPVSKPTPKR